MSTVALKLFPWVVTVDEKSMFSVAQIYAQRRHLHVDGVLQDSRLPRGRSLFAKHPQGVQDRLPTQRRIKCGRSDVRHGEFGIIFVGKVKRGEDGGTLDD